MEGPSATIALVLAETAAGAVALLWLGRLWGGVRRGFFLLTSSVALACALLATMSASAAAVVPVAADARTAVLALAATSGVLGLSVCALLLRLDGAARVLGIVAVPAAVAALGTLAGVAPSFAAAAAQLAAGAFFLGAVTDGLLLGHWYLTDRRLSRDHIGRFAVLLLAAVAVEAVALAVFGFGSQRAEAGEFSVILGVSGLVTWLALGMVACTALIGFLIRASLRAQSSRAVQGATGFFYLAVITAFTGEMAAKVGFLG